MSLKDESIPPWLTARRTSPRRGAGGRGGAARVAAVLALLAAGGVGGYLVRAARDSGTVAVAAPPVAEPAVCPPAVPCGGGPAAAPPRPAAAARRSPRPSPPQAAALDPLPAGPADDPAARKAALRKFAGEQAGDLRACLKPSGGAGAAGAGSLTAHRVGAAIETDVAGGVDDVQIIGAEPPDPRVRRCYSDRIKRWSFPRDLVRGREKILVTFAF